MDDLYDLNVPWLALSCIRYLEVTLEPESCLHYHPHSTFQHPAYTIFTLITLTVGYT
jgi:hypothetical protein